MAEPQPYTGTRRRNPDGSKYKVKRHHYAAKPPPPDFRETFIEIGYDAERWYQCRWPVFRRWLDECGGPELLAARREYLHKNGFNRIAQVRHVKGWSAEKLRALHNG